MKLDRESIEKRDFPLARRGYDKDAVDAHLRVIARELEDVERSGGGDQSLAAAASSEVQGIVKAAETTAASIKHKATEDARRLREGATSDAASTRNRALGQAQAYVQEIAQLAAALRERVEAMDREMSTLSERLGASAGRLLSDLEAAEENMGRLYEAAAGRTLVGAQATPSTVSDTEETPEEQPTPPAGDEGTGDIDVDGARLVALNMALNGDSRELTDRYLAENFQLPDRRQLLDEVYAHVES